MARFEELKIRLRGGNAAFGEDGEVAAVEIKRVLTVATEKIERMVREATGPYAVPNSLSTKWETVRDINGNSIGMIELTLRNESEDDNG